MTYIRSFNRFILISLALLGMSVSSGSASAAIVVIGPTAASVSSPDGSPFGNVDNIINQTGLSASYVSGVTDFMSYTGTTTAAYAGGTSSLGLGGVAGLGSFYFDLGASYDISAVATRGQDCCPSTITGYDLYSSDTYGAGGSRSLIGSFGAGVSPLAYVGLFTAVTAQFLEIDVTTNAGFPASRFQEVVFGAQVSAVPVPASVWLFGTALIGFVGMSRRRKVA
jgi:hypothetical protein